jgi:(p)ppGpp synthase/HD superfamily hydrolase
MSRVLAAKVFAKMAHEGQKRNVTGEDYYSHCLRVFNILKKRGERDEVLIAALLHDVIEDTHYNYIHIGTRFGNEVADLVLECSKPYNYLQSADALKIKFADLLDNVSDHPTKTWVARKAKMIKGNI